MNINKCGFTGLVHKTNHEVEELREWNLISQNQYAVMTILDYMMRGISHRHVYILPLDDTMRDCAHCLDSCSHALTEA